MLVLTVKPIECFDNKSQQFFYVGPKKPKKYRFEHSLIALSKWEERWKVPFLTDEKKTDEQIMDYVRCMCLDGDLDDETLYCIKMEHLKAIADYISEKRTASVVHHYGAQSGKKETLTSELLYYYLSAFNLPLFAEKWHLSRLLVLIEIANAKQSGKKLSKTETAEMRRKINEERRKAAEAKSKSKR